MKISLVWFTTDLRLHDNEVICQAIANSDQVIYCYCVENDWFKITSLGFKKADIHWYKFLKQSVENLQLNIKNLNATLIIKKGTAVRIIPELIKKYKITNVYSQQQYASEELNLYEKVKQAIPKTNFISVWGKTLYHIDDIPFEIDNIPLTSKAYRIPTAKKSNPRIPFKKPETLLSPNGIPETKFPEYTEFGFSEEAYKRSSPLLIGGEDAGLNRLQYYTFESFLLTEYRWTRNKSLGLDYSSKFSAYLAFGCLSPRTIYKTVRKYENEVKKNQSTWHMVFELVWRDYFTFKGMRFGNKIFQTAGFKDKKTAFENNKNYFERWCNGETGIPFVDAHMRQLNATGFMSNRGRVNCSSYLIHDLKIDWTWGAAYFESQLIDYDVSANWLNWHVQAYEIYYTNPVHQSNKYKSQEFIRKWIPALNDTNDIETLIPWNYDIHNYPKPIEIYKKWTRAINLIEKIKV